MVDKSKLLGAALIGAALSLGAGAAMAERGDHPRHGPTRGFDFKALDLDKDGVVTREDFDAARKDHVAAFDGDGDGFITADELTAARLKAVTARIEAQSAKMLKRLDVDADGKLSAAELMAGPMPGDAFERLDADGDGKVTEQELKAAEAKPKRGPRGDHPHKPRHAHEHGKGEHGKHDGPKPGADAQAAE